MASSRVMASSSSANSDLTRQSSLYSMTIGELQSSVTGDGSKSLGSMNMEDLFRSICSDTSPAEAAAAESAVAYGGGIGGGGEEEAMVALAKGKGGKTVEEVLREINAGRKLDGEEGIEQMTLEDYLEREGAVREEDVRSSAAVFGMDPVAGDHLGQQMGVESQILGFGNAVEGVGGRGRGRKRLVMDPVDRVALQRQKRMIKNRESAARSRERKQAYTAELETLVTQLEEENAALVSYQEEQHRKRLQQLMENLIPVTEKKRSERSDPLKRSKSV